jgi:hypothetical protein
LGSYREFRVILLVEEVVVVMRIQRKSEWDKQRRIEGELKLLNKFQFRILQRLSSLSPSVRKEKTVSSSSQETPDSSAKHLEEEAIVNKTTHIETPTTPPTIPSQNTTIQPMPNAGDKRTKRAEKENSNNSVEEEGPLICFAGCSRLYRMVRLGWLMVRRGRG